MATKSLQRRVGEARAESLGGPTFVTAAARRLSCGDLLDALKTDYELRGKASAQNLSYIKSTKEDLGTWVAVAVTSERVDRYIEEKLGEKYAPASINRRTQMLSQSFALAVRRGTLARAPRIRRLSEKGNERQGFFSEEEIASVLAALPDDGLRDFCEWASETGQRKGEVEQLTWSMVEGAELRIPGRFAKTVAAVFFPSGRNSARFLTGV